LLDVEKLRGRNERVAFSYGALGQSAEGHPAGYTLDHNAISLGQGERTWSLACEALRSWKMFPPGWTAIEPAGAPIRQGETLTMLAHGFGLWWLNGCRIVYVVNEHDSSPRRFGFAYGTLVTHVEEGEERFMVEMREDGSVWYDIRAFSRPRFWPVRLFKPLARRLQRRFARESLSAMKAAVEGG
jgi:uncharacterized protein (UPF0548 family)